METKCPICGEIFEKKSNCQRFCSKKCQQKYARQKLKKAKTESRKCPVCNKIFLTYEEANQVCCSANCYEIYHRNNMREYARRKQKPKAEGGCKKVDTCLYGSGGICQYILITGRMRDCEVEECTRYKFVKKANMPRMWSDTYGGRIRLLSEMQTDGNEEG